MPSAAPVHTYSGEVVQPIRLAFDVADRAALVKVFDQLACVGENAARPSAWFWFYEDEAAGIGLPRPPAKIAKELRPVIIAKLTLETPTRLVIAVRSPERAIAALRFFGKRFGEAASLRRVRMLDRWVTGADLHEGAEQHDAIDGLLDRDVRIVDADAIGDELEAAANRGATRAERMQAFVQEDVARRARDRHDEVEDFPVHLEDEGPDFKGLDQNFKFRAMRAFQRSRGFSVTLAEVIKDGISRQVGDGGWLEWSSADVPTPPAGPKIRRLRYFTGLFASAAAASEAGARLSVAWSGEAVPATVQLAWERETIEAYGGLHGDESIGSPVEVDELEVETEVEVVRVRVLNRNIAVRFHETPALRAIDRFLDIVACPDSPAALAARSAKLYPRIGHRGVSPSGSSREPRRAPSFATTGPRLARELPGRNDPCWCGSGAKYKKCHLTRDEEDARARAEA